ncbi:acetyl-CoA carboxylase carboxyltransferase subunit alpha [Pelobacter propionicus]|uniref:Acetyl-coenzyme A carboxylase carboxyl transferase subunit alpha n=1 Tax=Pelobacter propionicus (strain DSM 2379 / NBRC 103807 / OttBd1) TaxID=338966 RepID=A1AQQ7_PELPD|nr:acetyl-CoA carboxylase carboxyltransferase subunit alpha [Pelobacter propionicus]ABK99677.1 acetyl-CoA carboxylase carboxyltransferase subunit alpha [Pelobacter propionicus DSM 2379]
MAVQHNLEFEKPIVELEQKIEELNQLSREGLDIGADVAALESRVEAMRKEIFSGLSRWQTAQVARHINRPFTLDYIREIFTDFTELHGDRTFGDDTAIVGGLARLDGRPVMVMGHQKGRDTKEKVFRNFGMPNPEGYRKALRLMKMAEQFRLPVITFVDTPGAYPGIGAEERGQAEAIARNLRDMASLKTPVVVCITGEGGSGGALAIAVGNRVLMLEHSVYSVISPEGCAAILWSDGSKGAQAADALKLTAQDIISLGVIDEIVPEPVGGAHRDHATTTANLKQAILRNLASLANLSDDALLEDRYRKFRAMSQFVE